MLGTEPPTQSKTPPFASFPYSPAKEFFFPERNTRGRTCLWYKRIVLSNQSFAVTQWELSIFPCAWLWPGSCLSHRVQTDNPHSPKKFFIKTTAVKYWWRLASSECSSWRLSHHVMELNSIFLSAIPRSESQTAKKSFNRAKKGNWQVKTVSVFLAWNIRRLQKTETSTFVVFARIFYILDLLKCIKITICSSYI